MRIDQFLAHTGFGSRKDVKQLLKQKIVTVDDQIITKPNKHIDPEQVEVLVDGIEVVYQQYVYLMLHKPQGVISATYDDYDETVIDLVPIEYAHYPLAPVGRLDKDTEGLLLLTNDGKINHILTSPKREIFKTYLAEIDGEVKESHIDLFAQGVTLDDGYVTKSAHLTILESGPVSKIELSISEGKFHQVKRMFEAIDTKVIYLKRLSMGELTLDESLPLADVRELNEDEMAYIKRLKNN